MKTKILITGGSGLIGQRLVDYLGKDRFDFRILTRSRDRSSGSKIYYWWDTDEKVMDEKALDGVSIVINLAGTNIADKRWTEKRKKLILTSRVDSLMTLKKYLKDRDKVPLLIAASAIGYYGDKGESRVDETAAPGEDFLAEVVRQWEAASKDVSIFFERHVILRIGILLSSQGGALAEILKPARWGVYGYFGDGKAFYSWIHIDDLCEIVLNVILNNKYNGIYNAVSTDPLRLKNFIQCLKAARDGKGIVIGIPEFILRIILGEMGNTLTTSTYVLPTALLSSGYKFRFTDLEIAFRDLIERKV